MLDIPLMLWYYDKYQHSSETVERSALHKTASKIAKQIQAGLSTWKSEWLDRATWRRPHEQTLEQLDSDLPIFRYPNPNDPTQNIEPTPLVYPNGALFAVICNYNAALIIVHDTVRRLEGHEDFSLQISVAREICRSMSYFLMYLLPSRLGRIAFALVTAYDNLPVDGPEREYLADVYHSCAGGSWRRFDDFLQEFSVTPKA